MINGLKVTEIPLVRMQLQSHKKKLKQISNRKFPFIIDRSPSHKQQSMSIDKNNTSKDDIFKKRSISLSQSKHNFFASLSFSETQRLNKLKQNHTKSYSYHKNKKQTQINHENSLIYEKLNQINQRVDPNNPLGKRFTSIKNTQNSQITEIVNQESIINQQPSVRKQHRKMAKDFVYRKKQSLAIQATNLQIGKRIMNSTAYYNHQKDLQDFTKTRQIINRLGKFQTVQRLLGKSPKRSKTLPNKLPNIYTQQSETLL